MIGRLVLMLMLARAIARVGKRMGVLFSRGRVWETR